MSKPRQVDSEKYRVSAHLPDALVWGTADAVGSQVLTVAAPATLTVAAELTRPVPAGHCLEVWTHFVSDIGRPQLVAPAESGYFVAEASEPATPFVHPDAKVHGSGSFFPYRRYAGVRLDEAAPVGSRFTFRIADVSMQTYEETLFNLRVAVVDGDDVVGYLGDAFYTVVGAEPEHLLVVAPTCVSPGEPFDIKIITRDRFGNKTGGAIAPLGFEVALAEGEGTVPYDELVFDAKWRRHIVRGAVLAEPGVWFLHISARGAGGVTGVSNPIVVRDAWNDRIVWGDIHQHTYLADGRGTPAANIEYAVSTSCLDFVSISAHQELTYNPPLVRMSGAPRQQGWEEMQAATEAYNGEEIATILGSEAGGLGPVAGHMNSYFLDLDNRPEFERMDLFFASDEHFNIRDHEPETFYTRYLAELARSKGPYLLLPHAHACGGPGRFDLPRCPAFQTNVEVVSVHGVFEECYRRWLEHGHLVGVNGGGDNHMTSTGSGNPGWHYPNTNGMAAALVTERSREDVFAAFRDRRTYAVTGNQRIFLEFGVDGARMGDIVAGSRSATHRAWCRVAGTAPVMRVDLLRNGQVVASHQPDLAKRDTLRLCWTDDWGSRRVDDSETTGSIALEGGVLSVRSRIHAYHRTDRIETQRDGTLVFRSNGYSGITRGAVLVVTTVGEASTLAFTIHDVHLGDVLLDETLPVPLDDRRTVVTRPLGDVVRPPCFEKEPVCPEFRLEADWIDSNWPKVVELAWDDDPGGDAFYYVRVEQIDGNIAWSSPVWFLADAPAASQPGPGVPES